MVHVIEKNTPSHAEKMRKIESHILNAEMLITGQLARSPNYRQRDVMHAAAIDLDQASVVPRVVLNGKCVAPCTLTRTIDSPENEEEEGEEGRRGTKKEKAIRNEDPRASRPSA